MGYLNYGIVALALACIIADFWLTVRTVRTLKRERDELLRFLAERSAAAYAEGFNTGMTTGQRVLMPHEPD